MPPNIDPKFTCHVYIACCVKTLKYSNCKPHTITKYREIYRPLRSRDIKTTTIAKTICEISCVTQKK